MTFEVAWTQKAKNELNTLERETIIRIIKKIEYAKQNPYLFLRKLVGEKCWKLRVGDYRILIDIDSEKNMLYVLKVGHRRDIYRKIS